MEPDYFASRRPQGTRRSNSHLGRVNRGSIVARSPHVESNATYINVSHPKRPPRRKPPQLNQDELLILHPSIDIVDKDGDAVQIMYEKWLNGIQEQEFSSAVLYCEM